MDNKTDKLSLSNLPTFKVVQAGAKALLQGGGSRGGETIGIQAATPSTPKP